MFTSRSKNLLEVGELCDLHTVHPYLPAQSPGAKHLLVIQVERMHSQTKNLCSIEIQENYMNQLNCTICHLFPHKDTQRMPVNNLIQEQITGLSQLSSTNRISCSLTSIPVKHQTAILWFPTNLTKVRKKKKKSSKP